VLTLCKELCLQASSMKHLVVGLKGRLEALGLSIRKLKQSSADNEVVRDISTSASEIKSLKKHYC
jgi:hypothetical protein